MATTVDLEQTALIGDLNQGKELAKQLMNHLHPSSSHETREFLVEKILSCYEKALSTLNCGACVGEPKLVISGPKSDQDYKHKDVYKKR